MSEYQKELEGADQPGILNLEAACSEAAECTEGGIDSAVMTANMHGKPM